MTIILNPICYAPSAFSTTEKNLKIVALPGEPTQNENS